MQNYILHKVQVLFLRKKQSQSKNQKNGCIVTQKVMIWDVDVLPKGASPELSMKTGPPAPLCETTKSSFDLRLMGSNLRELQQDWSADNKNVGLRDKIYSCFYFTLPSICIARADNPENIMKSVSLLHPEIKT